MTPPPDEKPGRQPTAVWLANLEEELLAPANALRELGSMLLEDVEKDGPAGLVGDLLAIQAVTTHLEDLIRELIPRLGRRDPAELKKFRHELMPPLQQITGYCDLWIDEDDDPAVAKIRPQLERMRAAGTQLNKLFDGLRSIGAEPPPADTETSEEGAAAALGVFSKWPADRPTIAPGRVLVVDDNDFNREVLARRLERQGHTVTEAANGRQALDLLAAEPFDVLLLDILMPEINGLEVLKRLKANPKLRHLPVVMISALNEIDNVAQCLTLGADDFLPRPYNAVILRARVDALLQRKRLTDREEKYRRQIESEKERADSLLRVILPHEAVVELQATGQVKPRVYENVAVLFSDIVSFTPYCQAHQAEDVVSQLQRLIESFEEAALACGVQKIKTIGDCFMAASGLLRPSENPVLDCMRLGEAMMRAAGDSPPHWKLRVGIHVGKVIGGVVGKRQYLFDIFGDTVNTAARVQSHGLPATMTLSAPAWSRVSAVCRGSSRGMVAVKGKGEMELVQFEGFA